MAGSRTGTVDELDQLTSKAADVTAILLQSKNLLVTDLPSQLWSFTSLTVLNVAKNNLSSVPSEIGQLTSLIKLNLSSNDITVVSAGIGKLGKLLDLDLGRNKLQAVPTALGSLLSLKYLNLMNNSLTAVPSELGNLSALYRLGLKGNQLTHLPESFAGLKGLVELFITDNCLVTLPDGMSGLTSLVKLQASFNQLKTLPAAMGHLPKLELMRVAVNNIEQVPAEFGGLNALAWFSLAGNPACQAAPPIRPDILPLTLSQLDLATALGDGASGDVFAAKFQGRDVAIKIFKAESSPDGHASDEIAVTCFVDHPNLIKVIGIIDHPHALVLERVWGVPLALKPNFESLLRCRWTLGQTFTTAFVWNVAKSVANALAYLHKHNICHGDVYGHNVLADEEGNSVLCDYGASFFYQAENLPYEAQEVRAYGLLLHDLVSRLKQADDQSSKDTARVLQNIVQQCIGNKAVTAQRPTFYMLHEKLT
ncbi:TPA: hypothetical protein ACH3X1_000645 [Trebouxia sp. C0004]